MNLDEVTLAMEAFRQVWPYVPMSKVQDGQYQRLFAGYPTSVMRGVLDDMIRVGVRNRPGPAEMGELLRTKIGATPAGQRAHRDGPYLDETPPASLTAAAEISSHIADIRAANPGLGRKRTEVERVKCESCGGRGWMTA